MKITMLGGHASGKTSYLGALWATVSHADPNAPATLRTNQLPPNSTYLDECEYSMLAGEPVERTRRDHGESVSLDLLIDGAAAQVTHLDVAGETYETALEERQAAPSLLEELATTDAVMLFVHPNRLRLPSAISEASKLAELSGQRLEVQSEGAQTPSEIDPAEVWKHAPTAVHLVELLQLVLETRTSPAKLAVSVVVSAWDLVDSGPDWGTANSPGDWMQKHLPMLHQFLSSNRAILLWNYFGVSAQGCSFDDVKAFDVLMDRPCAERTVVTDGDSWTNDISEPLRWFISQQAALSP